MNVEEIREEIRARLGEDVENFWADTQIERAINQACQRFAHEERWPWLLVQAAFTVAAAAYDIELIEDVDFTRQMRLELRPTADTNDYNLVAPEKVSSSYLLPLRQTYWDTTSTGLGSPKYYALDHRVVNTYVSGTDDSDTIRAIGSVVRLCPQADKAYTGSFRFYRNVRLIGDTRIVLAYSAAADYVAGDIVSDAAVNYLCTVANGASTTAYEPGVTVGWAAFWVVTTPEDDVPDCPIQYHEAIVALATGNLWTKELNGGTKAQEQWNIYNMILAQAKKDLKANADDEVQVVGAISSRSQTFSEEQWIAMQLAGGLGT